MNSLFGKLDDIAIERLKTFEANAIAKNPKGYYVAYSGGKDSDVILDLVRRSGVKYEAHHHLTTADPPEIVRLQDKWKRLKNFALVGSLKVKDESFEDTLKDNAVYSLLAIILWREKSAKDDNPVTIVDLTGQFRDSGGTPPLGGV